MSEILEIHAVSRTDVGKGSSRRLRRASQIPAVIYGGEKEAQSLTIDHNKVLRALEDEAFYSRIITVNVDGKPEKAVLKALQRHSYKPKVLHMDFLRVSQTDKLHMNVPLHFINDDKCPAIKAGGLLSKQMTEVEISCLASDLPEFIEVDLSNVELDKILHLSDIKFPKGVESTTLAQGPEHDLPIASVHKPRTSAEDVDAQTTEGK